MLDGIAHEHDRLAEFLARHRRLLVLTGAGVSTASGIPDYRDDRGQWKLRKPIQYQDFTRNPLARQRYWARSALGWPRFRAAAPGQAHRALAELERRGRVATLITQNVDGLHQRAGSERVIDLHGLLDRVICLDCGAVRSRETIQSWLLAKNPELRYVSACPAPDGDAQLEALDFASITVPDCELCGGILKPDVVFFGESVPAVRVEHSFAAVEQADAMLVVGSSLMVYSGFRFVRRASELNLPVVAVNRGVTRADHLLAMKLERECGEMLASAVTALSAG